MLKLIFNDNFYNFLVIFLSMYKYINIYIYIYAKSLIIIINYLND
jgi:hypothetical protein